MTKFSDQLIKLRTEKNMSQEQLADKLYITRQAISKWEKGSATPDLDKTIQLAKLFDVSLDELVLGKNVKKPTETSKPGSSGWYKVDNGWEFIAKFWWIPIALIGALSGLIHAFIN